MVQAVQREAGDVAVCALASATCEQELRDADPARRPKAPPVVIGTAVMQPVRRADGAWDSGGFLLQLCGVDGRGDDYYSEMLVFAEEEGRLISVNTAYWLGMTVAGSPVERPPGTGSSCP